MRWALIVAAVAACQGKAVEERAAKPEPTPPPPPVAVVPSRVTLPPSDGPSVYDLDIHVHTADGRARPLDLDRGHTVLLSMFYGSCPLACPALIGELQRTLADYPGSQVRVLLVSFDPARDTPAHLTEVAQEHHLDARWTLASASEHDARALAAVLGFKYRLLADGNFAHNTIVLALDRDGRPIARMQGLGDHEALAAALQ